MSKGRMEAFSDGVIAIITIMVPGLMVLHGRDSVLATAVGRDFKGKVSIVLYLVAIPLAFVSSWLVCALYVLVAIIWFVPDRRIETTLKPPTCTTATECDQHKSPLMLFDPAQANCIISVVRCRTTRGAFGPVVVLEGNWR